MEKPRIKPDSKSHGFLIARIRSPKKAFLEEYPKKNLNDFGKNRTRSMIT
jgi:hypothetical protein